MKGKFDVFRKPLRDRKRGKTQQEVRPHKLPPCADVREGDYSWSPDEAEIAAAKQADEDRKRRNRLINALARYDRKLEQYYLKQIERIKRELEEDRKWLEAHKDED